MADGTRRRKVNTTRDSNAQEQQDSTKFRATNKNNASEDVAATEEPLPSLWNFSTWPSYAKYYPLYTILMIIAVVAYNSRQANLAPTHGLDTSSFDRCTATFNYSFRINAARYHSFKKAFSAAEIGTAAEAQLELLSPQLSVFGPDPFPNGALPPHGWLSLVEAVQWAHKKTSVMTPTLFANETFSLTAPAALGVYAVMASKFWGKGIWLKAATRQKTWMLDEVQNPRWQNGAVSYRVGAPEVWAESMSFLAPFLAYYGVGTKDVEAVRESVRQVQLHREVLRLESGRTAGLWRHSVAGKGAPGDIGSWSIGNGWAAYGMARVRATASKWAPSNVTMASEIEALDGYIAEILDTAIATDDDHTQLLRNYMGAKSTFGETSGTALMAATAYRMAVLNPKKFATPKYLDWAESKRRAVVQKVDDDGNASPAVDPSNPRSRKPAQSVTSIGSSFVVIMGSSWRDCVCTGVCAPDAEMKVRQDL